MAPSYIPPTRADMNRGVMPEGVPPTLAQIKKGARYPGKPHTLHETKIMRKYGTDLRTARLLEKEERRREKEKFSDFL